MVNNCLKTAMICGIIFSSINTIVYLTAFTDFFIAVDNYETYAEDMTGDDASDHFDPSSEWFTAISAEYEALSDFDKENVYCDVVSIQASPDAHKDDINLDLSVCMVMAALSTCGYLLIGCNACNAKCDRFSGVDIVNIVPSDPENPMSRAKIAHPLKTDPKTPEQLLEEDLMMYRSDTGYLFLVTGAFIGVIWLLIHERVSVTGTDCQAKFYECGESGDCTMDDMMTTVPLNSSLMKMLIAYPFIMPGFFTGFLSLIFVLVSGIWSAAVHKNRSFAYVHIFIAVFGLTPFVWVYFIDDLVPFDGALAVTSIAMLPLLMTLTYTLVLCCSCICKYDKYGRPRRNY